MDFSGGDLEVLKMFGDSGMYNTQIYVVTTMAVVLSNLIGLVVVGEWHDCLIFKWWQQ